MSLNLTEKFDLFKTKYQGYLAISASGTSLIFNHKLDLIEIYSFIYNIEITSSEIAQIFNIVVDTAEFDDGEASEERDESEIELDYLFSLLEYRASLYNDDYPFIIRGNASFKLKSDLSNKHKSYLTLLCASNLNRFSEFTKLLTDDFERLTYYSLRNLYGSIGQIREFGQNSEYTGMNTKEKLIKLAEELNVSPDTRKMDDHISKYSSKDRGSDVVSWIPFNDKNPNMPMMFTQCACGMNWKSKLVENRKMLSFYKMQQMITSFGFAIPFEFSTPQNEFEYLDDVESGSNIILGRSRLLQHIRETDTFDSFNLINKILESDFRYT